MTRLNAIQQALRSVYRNSPTGTILRCARYIDSSLEIWRESDEGLAYEVHMCIWNYFPGGSTAQVAALKVINAVEEM